MKQTARPTDDGDAAQLQAHCDRLAAVNRCAPGGSCTPRALFDTIVRASGAHGIDC